MKYVEYILLGFLVVLFGYSAVTKLIDFPAFAGAIYLEEFLVPYTVYFGIGVIAVELSLALFLLSPQLRNIGLMVTISLLAGYILYILYLRFYFEIESCGCKILFSSDRYWLNILRNLALIGIAAFLFNNGTGKGKEKT